MPEKITSKVGDPIQFLGYDDKIRYGLILAILPSKRINIIYVHSEIMGVNFRYGLILDPKDGIYKVRNDT